MRRAANVAVVLLLLMIGAIVFSAVDCRRHPYAVVYRRLVCDGRLPLLERYVFDGRQMILMQVMYDRDGDKFYDSVLVFHGRDGTCALETLDVPIPDDGCGVVMDEKDFVTLETANSNRYDSVQYRAALKCAGRCAKP